MRAPFSVFIILSQPLDFLHYSTNHCCNRKKNIVVALLYAFFAAPNIVVHVAAVL
jgi:hypothetical protein